MGDEKGTTPTSRNNNTELREFRQYKDDLVEYYCSVQWVSSITDKLQM